ncbi:ABC transporter permease [Anaerosporobacter faecicola]|uniref:ABC transporter permease n=1 Tax=Anaerosporobacter faecicola TaxID=2718714 RepID=UPI00143B5DBE|nr:ABC transporter permease [Anaerosporobacter faecicola]
MGKFSIITLSKIRKNKGQYITFGIILMIAAMILNLGLMIKRNFQDSFTEKWDHYDTADVTAILMKPDYSPDYVQQIEQIKHVKAVGTRECIWMSGSYKMNGSQFDMDNIFFNYDEAHEYSKLGIVKEKEITCEQPAYVSYYLSFAGYDIGDTYVFTTNNVEHAFTIVGFVEDMTFGTQSLGKLGIYLPEESFQELKDSVNQDNIGTCMDIKLTDKKESKAVTAEITDLLSGKMTEKYSVNYYDYCKQVRTMTASVGGMCFLAFACVIGLVSVLISVFRINNDIEVEMQNMGVMKAVGYKGIQIIFSTIVSYIVIAFVASVIGVGFSYLALPPVQAAFDAQTGFCWQQGFDVVSSLLTVCATTVIILLSSYLAARKIRRLQAITALRGGVKTHNFKKNYFAMDQAKGNVNIVLALKNIVANGKKNLLLLLVIMATTISAVFAGTMYYNMAVEPKAFLEAISEPISDVGLTIADSDDTQFLEEIEQDDNVDFTLYYDSSKVTIAQEERRAFITADFSKMDYSICYEGRDPIHNNEIAIGSKLVEEENYKIGDTIRVTSGTIEEEYLITGFIQSVNEQGSCVELTEEGIKRVNPSFKKSQLNIYLKDNTKTGAYIKELQEQYGEQILGTVDGVKSTESAMQVFIRIAGILAVIIIVITIALIALILFILVKTVIHNGKVNLGISKAIGYTTRQLRLQTTMSFLPVVLIGVILGGFFSYAFMNSSIVLLFHVLGVMKLTFLLPIPMLIGVGVGILLVSLCIAYCLSGRIRKISAYELIQE